MSMRDFLGGYCKLFITADTSNTANADSDWKVCTLMAITRDQTLFVLDMWAGKTKPEKLQDAAFAMAAKWGCKRIAPEAIDAGKVLEQSMKNQAQIMASKIGSSNTPLVKGFNPGYTTKTSKISAINHRFEHGKIKLPFFARGRSPWAELFEQIDGFNPDASADGGLQHDDHLDTVAMSEYVIGAPVMRYNHPDQPTEKSVLQHLEDGGEKFVNGVPVAACLDINKLTIGELLRIGQLVQGSNKEDEYRV